MDSVFKINYIVRGNAVDLRIVGFFFSTKKETAVKPSL
jgi:hypothetical protein